MRDEILSRNEIEARIAEGELIVVHSDKALRLNGWIERHPGGDKAIFHMVGRDATDQINVYHSQETLSKIHIYQIGRIELPWVNFTPPIQGGIFRTREEQANPKEQIKLKREKVKEAHKQYSSEQERVIEDYDQILVSNDLHNFPDLDLDTQLNMSLKFRKLYDELEQEGLFQCNYWDYVKEFSRIFFLFILARVFFSMKDQSVLWLSVSACLLGFGWHQLTFIAHDAGHIGITHNFQFDSTLGMLVAAYCGGLSLGWWKRNHNVHHFVTNNPTHDPDIQHLPFFAVSSKFLGNLTSTFYDRILDFDAVAKKFIPVQNYTYYPILCFGRFNLYRLSLEHLIFGLGPRKGKSAWHRYFELVGMAFFGYWFFYRVVACSLHTAPERWIYVMVSHVVTMPLHVQITLSHFAMSTSELGMNESFCQRQLRTTMDVECPEWFDFLHGGLQFQAIHHLFPRMPRHNLRHVQKRVIQFCNEVGLKYEIYGFTKGNMKVLGKLGEVAKQARIMAECNKFCQQEVLNSGLH